MSALLPPLFIVAPPFCGASRLAATLGTHPALYAIPETALFVADRVDELLEIFEIGQGSNADGLLRALAELEFGEQNDAHIDAARQWLAARGDWTTARVLEHLATRAAPRRLLVPETESVLRPADLQRLRRGFPDAAIIHLVRHPWTYGVMFAAWLEDRLFVPADFRDHGAPLAPIDPQIAWLRINSNLERHLQAAYGERYLRIGDEALRDDRLGGLAALARHAGVAADVATVAALRAGDWPFDGYGPRAAPYGLEAELLEALQLPEAEARLDALPPWRADGKALAAEVVAMARRYGYS